MGTAGLLLTLGIALAWDRISEARPAAFSNLTVGRPTEGRLTESLYAPFDVDSSRTQHESASFRSFANQASRGLAKERSVESLHGMALVNVVSLKEREAASLLEEAIKHSPNEASLYNDLAVVLMAKSTRGGDPGPLLPAMSAVLRTLRLEPSSEAALFNQALIFERLFLRNHAKKAWLSYIKVDPGSQWSTEARAHLAALEAEDITWESQREQVVRAARSGDSEQIRKLLARFAQPARLLVENEVLPSWARATLQGNVKEAKLQGDLAKIIAAVLAELTGDRLLWDSVQAIGKSKEAARIDLLAVHQEYGSAMAVYDAGDLERAGPLFAEVGRRFERAGSPFYQWALFYAAACDYRSGSVEAALASIQRLRPVAVSEGRGNLIGRIDWMAGLISLEKADPSQALANLQRSSAEFRKTREFGHQGAVHSLVALCLDYLGEPAEAWRYHHLALEAMQPAPDTARLPVITSAAARTFLKSGYLDASLLFQDEALLLVLPSRDPLRIAETFWWRAMVHQRVGRDALALADVASARSHCDRILHEPTRLRTLAGILVTEAASRRSSDPQRAIGMLDQALVLYGKSDYAYLLVDIFLERARARIAVGDFDGAESDLESGMSEYERQRRRVRKGNLQASYFDRAQDVLDEMVKLQIDKRGDFERALGIVERGKARLLLDGVQCKAYSGGCEGKPLDSATIRVALPDGTVMLQYHVLANRLLVWVLTRDDVQFYEAPVQRDSLARNVEELVSAIQERTGDSSFQIVSGELFEHALRPVAASIADAKEIVIVPGQALARVPFAALFDREKREYLVESHSLVVVPSATIYVAAVQRARDRAVAPQVVSLAFGDPAFDGARFSELSRLPFAETEARSLVDRLPGSLLLIGAQATSRRFVREANRYDIVHFAGHARVNYLNPEMSSLVFAEPKGSPESGELYAREVSKMELTRPRLVVLSACSTGLGRSRKLEGLSDLAGPFLVAGVPSVLAALWDVEDHETSVFWDKFYDAHLGQKGPGESLRSAQIAMIKSSDEELREPRYWAGFRLIGAGAFLRADREE